MNCGSASSLQTDLHGGDPDRNTDRLQETLRGEHSSLLQVGGVLISVAIGAAFPTCCATRLPP